MIIFKFCETTVTDKCKGCRPEPYIGTYLDFIVDGGNAQSITILQGALTNLLNASMPGSHGWWVVFVNSREVRRGRDNFDAIED